MKTTVGHVKDHPLFQDRDSVYYVGRGRRGRPNLLNQQIGKMGWLGNPFDGKREESIAKYKIEFERRLAEDEAFRDAVQGLRGMILTCFCHPKPCHADVIAEYLNSLPEE